MRQNTGRQVPNELGLIGPTGCIEADNQIVKVQRTVNAIEPCGSTLALNREIELFHLFEGSQYVPAS